jgi:hypothetical protein
MIAAVHGKGDTPAVVARRSRATASGARGENKVRSVGKPTQGAQAKRLQKAKLVAEWPDGKDRPPPQNWPVLFGEKGNCRSKADLYSRSILCAT